MTTTGISRVEPLPPSHRNATEHTAIYASHLRGITVAIWYPLAFFMYQFTPDVHNSLIDLVAKAMMWGGALLVGPYFIAPCFNEKRYGRLWYTATIPLILLLWMLDVGGIRG